MLKKTIVVAAFVGFAFTLNSPAPAFAGYFGTCINHKHTGTGRGPTKKSAKYAARQKWRYGVLKHKHSRGNLLWGNSVEQSSSCRRKYGIYKCRVQAYPCRKRPRNTSYRKQGIATTSFGEWCKNKYRNAKWAILIGKTAGDWVCLMKNGSHRSISVVGACKRNFGIPNIIKAKADNWNDPYSWKCYVRQ